MLPYLYAFYLASIDAVVMTLLKMKFLGTLGGSWVFPFSFAVYGSQALIFYKTLAIESMGIMNILWDVISDILVALIGVYYFGETLNTIQILGIGLSMVGMSMLRYKS